MQNFSPEKHTSTEKRSSFRYLEKIILGTAALLALAASDLSAQNPKDYQASRFSRNSLLKPNTATQKDSTRVETPQNTKDNDIDFLLRTAQEEQLKSNENHSIYQEGLLPSEIQARQEIQDSFAEHLKKLQRKKGKLLAQKPEEVPDTPENTFYKNLFKNAKTLFLTEKGRIIFAIVVEGALATLGTAENIQNNEPILVFSNPPYSKDRSHPRVSKHGGIFFYDLTEHAIWGAGMRIAGFSLKEALFHAISWEIKDGIFRSRKGGELKHLRGDGADHLDALITIAGYVGTDLALIPGIKALKNAITKNKRALTKTHSPTSRQQIENSIYEQEELLARLNAQYAKLSQENKTTP